MKPPPGPTEWYEVPFFKNFTEYKPDIHFFTQLPFLSVRLLHPTPLGFYGLEFLCGGHCSANVLQGGEQSAEHVKEALVPEGGDQAAAGRGCEGLGYLLTARTHQLFSSRFGTTWVAAAAPRGIR